MLDFESMQIEELIDVIESAQSILDEKKRTGRQAALEQIRALAKSYDLDVTIARAAPKSRSTNGNGSAATPLFRDPETGKTWTGKGRKPFWFRDGMVPS